jgi:hypothetical protein
MKNKLVNIAFLAFFHLFLFVTPLTVKALHHGVHETSCIPGIAIAKDNHCPICHFEFVSFKQPTQVAVLNMLQEHPIELLRVVDKVFLPFLVYFTLRAPPQF